MNRPAEEALEERIWGRFARFIPAYRRWVRARLKSFGIGYAWMRALGVLYCGEGPLIMSDIGEELGVTPRNVTKLVDELEAEGLVRRLPHPSDRRATLIDLTEVGREKIAEGYAEYVAVTSELFSVLSEEDQWELIRLMDLLFDGLENKGDASS
ncbi:MAG: MarR family transcriptional regulator [Actinobacteria bacterium]|nr:MarR family transcriptional regulator [Actinomycetota bacterium]MCA1739069.1 MarR family transcriptional regulator [Actinomycetota bacterium]